jgi:hypothetical protein
VRVPDARAGCLDAAATHLPALAPGVAEFLGALERGLPTAMRPGMIHVVLGWRVRYGLSLARPKHVNRAGSDCEATDGWDDPMAPGWGPCYSLAGLARRRSARGRGRRRCAILIHIVPIESPSNVFIDRGAVDPVGERSTKNLE